MVYIEVDHTEIDNVVLLWRIMLQNHLKHYKVNAKIEKKSFGNDSSDAIKTDLYAFFLPKCIWLSRVFFTQGRLFQEMASVSF